MRIDSCHGEQDDPSCNRDAAQKEVDSLHDSCCSGRRSSIEQASGCKLGCRMDDRLLDSVRDIVCHSCGCRDEQGTGCLSDSYLNCDIVDI